MHHRNGKALIDLALLGLDGKVCFFDDIAIKGNSKAELYEHTQTVLSKLRKYNLYVTKAKCKFFQSSVHYLGPTIDVKGLHKNAEKTLAIVATRHPENVSDLRKLLGMANYYNDFIPDLATKLHPLSRLLRNGMKFVGSEECERSFV